MNQQLPLVKRGYARKKNNLHNIVLYKIDASTMMKKIQKCYARDVIHTRKYLSLFR